jgi:hypothetical protein
MNQAARKACGLQNCGIMCSASSLLHAFFLLYLLFNPEDRRDMFLQTLVDFQWTVWLYIPKDRTFHDH